MMKRLLPPVAVLLPDPDVLGGVRMAGHRVEIGVVGQQVEKRLAVLHPVLAFRLIGRDQEGDVHGENQQPILGHMGEFGLKPRQLHLAQCRVVAASGTRILRCGRRTPVAHIVENHEHRVSVLEGVVGRAVPLGEGLQRVLVGGRKQVEFVVAGNVVPRNADLADDAVVAREHGQVVGENVAHGHAEGGTGADEFAHHAIADVVEFRVGLRLRVGKQDGLEAGRLLLSMQGEVDALGQRAGGFDAGIAKPGGRPFRAVQVVEARQAVGVQGRHVAGRLGDEHDAVAIHLELVGALVVREHDLPAVGDAHIGDAGLAGVGLAVAVQVIEHLAVKGVRQAVGHQEAGNGKSKGEEIGSRHAPHHS